MPAGLEVADVFRRHGEAYRRSRHGHLGRVERRVMSAIEQCRTAALGGHSDICSDCGHVRLSYNSCRNRHCPKCQGQARAEWLAARQAELLPVPYYHVVFTLPAPAAEIAFQNKRAVYTMLFRAAAETLRIIAADPKHLGAEIGFLAVLHTWGQNLHHHPHVHCIVPGGGPAPDAARWVACRPGFFLPVRVLSRLYRRLFLEQLRAAFEAGGLGFFGDLAELAQPAAFARRLRELRRIQWVVYAKRPFGGPAQVLAYLGRYTHRVAIANSRLVSITDREVAFRWKDYRHHGKTKVMRLEPHEFVRRFLLHTLPDGFHRIRHYGFLANGHRAEKLALCRHLLDATATASGARTDRGPGPLAATRPLPVLRRHHDPPRHPPAPRPGPARLLARHLMNSRPPDRSSRPAPPASPARSARCPRRANSHAAAPHSPNNHAQSDPSAPPSPPANHITDCRQPATSAAPIIRSPFSDQATQLQSP